MPLTTPDLAGLEEFIERQQSEFDALSFLGLAGSEEFHSKVLAWLLNPRESHGMRDHFLRNFLLETTAQAEAAGILAATFAERAAFDWSVTTVRREWCHEVAGREGYLDILLVNEKERFLCAVENKIFSSEHSNQLTRYRQALHNHYPNFDRHHVFLSPAGTRPYREEERRYWTPVSYGMILQLVEQMMSNGADLVPEDVGRFLHQYSTTLRRRIVADANTNIRYLARKVYLEHRTAIELLMECKPDYLAEMQQMFREAITEHKGWLLTLGKQQPYALPTGCMGSICGSEDRYRMVAELGCAAPVHISLPTEHHFAGRSGAGSCTGHQCRGQGGVVPKSAA